MLSDRDVELAHPEAFDFAFGNLPRDKRASFNRHLSGCGYCRSVVEEYGGIGPVLKNLPPHVEPPPGLEERTVAAMTAAMAFAQEKPADHHAAVDSRGDHAMGFSHEKTTHHFPVVERRRSY